MISRSVYSWIPNVGWGTDVEDLAQVDMAGRDPKVMVAAVNFPDSWRKVLRFIFSKV